MATIAEMESKMTIFYSKRTGEIKSYCEGIQDMSFFGADAEDYILIWDFIVVELDKYVLKNSYKFTVENKEIKLKKETGKEYPIAD